MLQEREQDGTKLIVQNKLYIGILLFLVLVIIPIHELKKLFEYYGKYNHFLQALGHDSTSSSSQLQITNFYHLLSRNPYRGTWESSIKRSEFLKQQQGSIQIRTVVNQTEYANNYDLQIRIIDGFYLDNGYFDISITTSSIKANQRYERGKVLYETTSPLIGFYKNGHIFKHGDEKALYINKLKFKILANGTGSMESIQNIKMQVLISSEYSLNIIGRQIHQYQQTAHDILFAILLLVQFAIQGFGIYKISQAILDKKQCASRYSKTGFLLSISFDVIEGLGLAILGTISTKKLAIFSFPILIIWVLIVIIQIRLLTLLYQEQFRQNSLKFSAKIYLFFCISFIVNYFSNLNSFYVIVTTLLGTFPQIYKNYMVGHKLKENMKYFLCYILPRYSYIVLIIIIQPYFRLYHYNIFSVQPDLATVLLCFFLLLLQCALIFVQMHYGVRSIVPKFLHPEELKYFLSQSDSQDDVCSICLISLKQKGEKISSIENIVQSIEHTQFRQVGGEEPYNSIVLTPCKHKFHIQCLKTSMKTKLECPNCRSILPPLQQYE